MRRVIVLLAVVALTACPENSVTPEPTDGGADGGSDAGLDAGADAGCQDAGPVKVLVLLDQSASMCLTDPPGSTQSAGFCEMYANPLTPPGVTVPARVRALQSLLDALSVRPEVSVAVVPFSLNPGQGFPTTGFTTPGDQTLRASVAALQSQLGSGTDYEGVLSNAYARVSADVAAGQVTDPALLARTRYVVVFITDGPPWPRCAADDMAASYANSVMPDGLWPDSPATGDFCNAVDGGAGSEIDGFVPGSDRNQNGALLALVDQLHALQGVASVTFHTRLLFNQANVTACGAICNDLYGTYPEVSATEYPSAALAVDRWLLGQFATHGGGTYEEFLDYTDGGIGDFTLSDVDLSNPVCP